MAVGEKSSSTKRFARRHEDFVCEVCGREVKGTGYTDHCPDCLCSKHVDMNPGDRKSKCNGIMDPIRSEYRSSDFLIYYRCRKCNYNHRVHSAKEDNQELLIALSI